MTPPMSNSLLTPEQAKARLESTGLSVAEFARRHNLPYTATYRVLHGLQKGKRGAAHNAAVLLGMKHGVVSAPGVAA